MSAKKVYDLAKEFDVPSKDFVQMLQSINIPVKNHMSAMSEQQEKYFRNNFEIKNNQIFSKGSVSPIEESGVKPENAKPAESKPANAPQRQPSEKTVPAERAKSDTPNTAQNRNSDQRPQRDNRSYNGGNNQNGANRQQNPNYRGNNQGGYRGNNQGGNPNYRGNNPNYQGNNQGGNPNYHGNNQGGTSPNYRGNNPNPNYQGNNQGGYRGNNQSGTSSNYRGNNPNPNYRGNNSNYQGNNQGGYRGNNQGGTSPNYRGNNPNPNYRGNNPNPNYQGNNQSGYRGNNQGGTSPNYRGNNPNPNYRGNNPNPNYQGNNQSGYRGNNQGGNNFRQQRNDGGFVDKDKDATRPNYQNRNNQNGVKKTATGDRPLEKTSKTDKNRKESKARNEQRSKAKENFFADDKIVGGIDNTKRSHGSKSDYKKKKLEAWEERATGGISGIVVLPESITIAELAEKILISPTDILKILISYGIMANVNQSIDADTASVVCEELGIQVKLEEEEDVIEKILSEHFADESQLKLRPPIVTVMGHVDHGKTSLLDAIRNTNVISGEAGGITQHIGAYSVTTHGKSITFIDTPGHAAFTAMRSRGASVTDIAILVVAADDGVMPQTIEAINHAKAAGVPVVVAVNKIDKPEANPEKVKQQLTEYGLVSESWGGETICAEISAKKNIGIDELLDSVLLVAEIEELKANYEKKAVGTFIEARLDKQRGITITALIKSGILRDGDYIVSGTIYGKVRVMTDDKGKRISEAGPSAAVEILGINEMPSAGDKFYVAENEKEAKKITDRRKDRMRLLAMKSTSPISLDDLFNQISKGELKELNLIVKADVQGSFEAIKQSLEKLNDNKDNIKLNIIHGGVGAVSETDVSLAYASNALILAFNVIPDSNAKAISARDSVEIRTYSVIYDMIEDIQAAMKGMLDPEFEEVVTAMADVRQIFRVPGVGAICGSYITSGTVNRNDKVRVVRNGTFVYDGNVSSLKRVKDDVKEVATGFECGIGIEKFNDVKEGDNLQFYKVVQKENK